MQKLDIKKLAGVSMLSLGLVVGVAGFAGATSGTIGTTGANSDNEIRHESKVDVDVDNETDVDLSNRNRQHASSGDVEVKFNTSGGDAETGSAMNSNALTGGVEVDNSGALDGVEGLVPSGDSSNSASINNTGYNSNNEVKYESRTEVRVDNDTDVNLHNYSEQSAHSGDASVKYNTTGGSATSGAVSNTNTASFSVRVTN